MNTQAISEVQAKAAAAWWRKAIERPKFDNGDDSPNGGMAGVLALTLAARNRASTERLDVFEAQLARALTGANAWNGVGVDYHPDQLLAGAADIADVDQSLFPWKTRMRFDGGGVQVSHGYRAPMVDVLART